MDMEAREYETPPFLNQATPEGLHTQLEARKYSDLLVVGQICYPEFQIQPHDSFRVRSIWKN